MADTAQLEAVCDEALAEVMADTTIAEASPAKLLAADSEFIEAAEWESPAEATTETKNTENIEFTQHKSPAADPSMADKNINSAAQHEVDPSIPDKKGTCHFFRLPAELRLQIYEHTLADYNVKCKATPGLLFTTRLTFIEARKLYLRRLIASFRAYDVKNMAKVAQYAVDANKLLYSGPETEEMHAQLDEMAAGQEKKIAKFDGLYAMVIREVGKFRYKGEKWPIRVKSS